MDGDPLQHVHQIDVGVDTVEHAGGDQALDAPHVLGAHFGPAEEPVLPAHRDHAQRPLQVVRVDRHVWVREKDLEPGPTLQGIEASLRERVGREQGRSRELLLEPLEELRCQRPTPLGSRLELGLAGERLLPYRLLVLVEPSDEVQGRAARAGSTSWASTKPRRSWA